MNLFQLMLLVAPLAYSRIVPISHQTTLVNLNLHAEREKVPGDNPAYYSREKAADQLFKISEFTISPYPPIPNHRIFFYLRGYTGIRDLPNLANATLELRANRPNFEDEPEYRYKNKISDFKLFTVRDEEDYTYGGPLVEGVDEMVGDFFVLNFGHDHGTIMADIEAVARLPDDRILFAFEARVEYEV